jgi:hypothetical protein
MKTIHLENNLVDSLNLDLEITKAKEIVEGASLRKEEVLKLYL